MSHISRQRSCGEVDSAICLESGSMRAGGRRASPEGLLASSRCREQPRRLQTQAGLPGPGGRCSWKTKTGVARQAGQAVCDIGRRTTPAGPCGARAQPDVLKDALDDRRLQDGGDDLQLDPAAGAPSLTQDCLLRCEAAGRDRRGYMCSGLSAFRRVERASGRPPPDCQRPA